MSRAGYYNSVPVVKWDSIGMTMNNPPPARSPAANSRASGATPSGVATGPFRAQTSGRGIASMSPISRRPTRKNRSAET